MRYSLSALLVLATICTAEVWADVDLTADVHLHTGKNYQSPVLTGFSDGLAPCQVVFSHSRCRVVVFTDHLDGVIERGCDLYLRTIRGLSNDKKLAIPGVEVTSGSGYSAYDVLVIGLTNESLAELSKMFKKGAFIDPENGLPCLNALADRYGFVLLAAHPENDKIPFDLRENSRFCDGFELFDSNHMQFTAERLDQDLAWFYLKGANQVVLASGSDYHAVLTGAVPTRSLMEAPVTHVIIRDGATIDEANVVDAFRRGRTYATSLLGARIVSATCTPGAVWDPSVQDRLLIVCAGIAEDSLIDEYFTVIVSNGQTAQRLKFRPFFKDGKAVLAITFAALGMPDAAVCNINFGGRLVTSTIKISPPGSHSDREAERLRALAAAGAISPSSLTQQSKGEVTIWVNGATPPSPASTQASEPRPVPNIAGTWVGSGDRQCKGQPFRVVLVFRQQGDKLEFTLQADGTTTDFHMKVDYTGSITSDGFISCWLRGERAVQYSGPSTASVSANREFRLLANGTIKQYCKGSDPGAMEFVLYRQ